MMIRHALIAAAVILLALSAPYDATATTNGSLGGRVFDQSGAPIAGASVRLARTARSTRTASDGTFGFAGLAPGSYTIEVRVGTNAPFTRPVVIAEAKRATVDIRLLLGSINLDQPVRHAISAAEARAAGRLRSSGKAPDGKKVYVASRDVVVTARRSVTAERSGMTITRSGEDLQSSTRVTSNGISPQKNGTVRTIRGAEIENSTRTSVVGSVGLANGTGSSGTNMQGTPAAPVDPIVYSGSTPAGNNGVSLRGGRDQETSIRVDGIEVSDPFAGGYTATSTAAPADATAAAPVTAPSSSTLSTSSVAVVQSGFSAEHGNVLSGVVNATTHIPTAAATATTAPAKANVTAATSTVAAASVQTPAAAPATSTPAVTLTRGVTSAAAVTTDPSKQPDDPATATPPAPDKSGENQFVDTRTERTSTFGIDVDGASYSLMRRTLSIGSRPDISTVRVEEFINYFTYDYPEPTGEDPFSITTEVANCPWNAGHRLVSIALQGKHMAKDVIPPSNLVFLIDVSGSMAPSDRLPMLRDAFRKLVEHLRAEDSVAIVVYAGAAGMVLPPTSGADQKTIIAAIDRMQSGGSTAGGAGITLAYDVAQQMHTPGANTRVILATDGDFNVGITNRAQLQQLIETRREGGVFLTALGVGYDNLRDRTLEMLADNGNGTYAYLDNIDEAQRVLVDEMSGTLVTIAKDVKLQVEFNPLTVKNYRLVGYENRVLANEDFVDDRKDAGDLGAGHRVTAFYEIELRSDARRKEDAPRLSDASMRYLPDRVDADPVLASELLDVRLRYKEPARRTSKLIEHPVEHGILPISSTSENFRFAAAVAEFGLLLRNSAHKGSATFENVLELARGALGTDVGGYRAEFLQLVEKARSK